MEKRITLVTMFDNEEINKIETLMLKTNKKTCKVPYGIDDEKRYEIDNLPYHFIFVNYFLYFFCKNLHNYYFHYY